jgi:hypothetical protein
MAAAIGAGLPVNRRDRLDGRRHRRRHHRGRRDLAGRHGVLGSVRVGGDKFDEAIINYIRRNYGMLIGETTAEAIKKDIGSAFPGSEVREMEVKGRNLAEGIPRSFTVTRQRDPRGPHRSAQHHRLGREVGPGADAARARRRHRRSRHGPHRRRRACCATSTGC